jgi:hypothetical protein
MNTELMNTELMNTELMNTELMNTELMNTELMNTELNTHTFPAPWGAVRRRAEEEERGACTAQIWGVGSISGV